MTAESRSVGVLSFTTNTTCGSSSWARYALRANVSLASSLRSGYVLLEIVRRSSARSAQLSVFFFRSCNSARYLDCRLGGSNCNCSALLARSKSDRASAGRHWNATWARPVSLTFSHFNLSSFQLLTAATLLKWNSHSCQLFGEYQWP